MAALLHDRFLLLHVSGLMTFLALALRNQLQLRIVLLVSTATLVVFHWHGEHGPEPQELFWDFIDISVNAVVVGILLLDKTHVGLSAEALALFEALKFLTPGEFRALMRMGRWETAESGHVITREGVIPDDLFYVLTGGATIEKGGRSFDIDPKVFIGEVAFLHGTPASATVRLVEGSRYVRWPVKLLERGLESKDTLRTSVLRLISLDTAIKVARA